MILDISMIQDGVNPMLLMERAARDNVTMIGCQPQPKNGIESEARLCVAYDLLWTPANSHSRCFDSLVNESKNGDVTGIVMLSDYLKLPGLLCTYFLASA
jgi:hypothetical protein